MAWSRHSKKIKALSLDRFAEIFGLNQVAFNQGTFVPAANYGCPKCNEFWYQSAFQAGQHHVTRDELAVAILSAERDLANFWGFPIVPEEKCAILPYNGGCAAAGGYYDSWPATRAITLLPPVRRPRYDNLYVINDEPIFAWGRQALTEVDNPALVIIDQNGDPYTVKNTVDYPRYLTATVPVGDIDPTCEFEIYRGGHGGQPEHRLREARVERDGDNLVIELDPWLAIRPELWENPAECNICTNSGSTPILDLLDPAVFIHSIVVMRRFFDDTVNGAEFGWRGSDACGCGTGGCTICELSTCPGCILHDAFSTETAVQIVRARWDGDEEQWVADSDCGACRREPDFVKVYYWHGYTSSPHCDERCVDTSEVEEIVAMMAAARLPKAVCTCKCNQGYDRFGELQASMNFSDRNSGSYFITTELVGNPFGTRRGEVDAYRKALAIKNRRRGGTVTTGAW